MRSPKEGVYLEREQKTKKENKQTKKYMYIIKTWGVINRAILCYQAPLSMGFSRQECWSVLLCPPPGDLPDIKIKSEPLTSPALAREFFTTHGIWSHHFIWIRRENSGNNVRLYFWGLQNHCRWWLRHEIKRRLQYCKVISLQLK